MLCLFYRLAAVKARAGDCTCKYRNCRFPSVTVSRRTYREFGEGRVGDVLPKGIFLELKKLDHQPSQRFVGRSIRMNVLQDKDGDSKTGTIVRQRMVAHFLLPTKHGPGDRFAEV